MDRMVDSGSTDWGSTPHGCTKKTLTFKSWRLLFMHILLYTFTFAGKSGSFVSHNKSK